MKVCNGLEEAFEYAQKMANVAANDTGQRRAKYLVQFGHLVKVYLSWPRGHKIMATVRPQKKRTTANAFAPATLKTPTVF